MLPLGGRGSPSPFSLHHDEPSPSGNGTHFAELSDTMLILYLSRFLPQAILDLGTDVVHARPRAGVFRLSCHTPV